MKNLSKSRLLAFRQCQKRLWLEVHRPELREQSSSIEARFQVGHEVGAIARQLYDPNQSGALIDAQTEGFDLALARSATLLCSSNPIFEAGFAAGGALAFADVMLPAGGKKPAWRMVEVKSSTSVKDYHRDDIAIQAFVALAAGVPLKSIAVAYIDSKWTYPGEKNYKGLLVEEDLTDEAFERKGEVSSWIAEGQSVVRMQSEPAIRMGDHCSEPYACSFYAHCHSQTKQPKYPVEWLPRLQTKAVKEYIATKDITDLRKVPDEYLNETQLRVKAHTISGETFFDRKRAAAELAQYKLPAYFLDFETVKFAVPIWKGTRPYQQIPYQFSLHCLRDKAALEHKEFLDLTGNDPSKSFGEALIDTCGKAGPVFVYNVAFESARMKEVAERFPRMKGPLLALVDRLVDLMPVARRYYYHPSQQGSWSIKSVLPAIADDLSYDDLEGVQDGDMAMTAYLEALHPDTAQTRKDEIRRQLLAYCALDTLALVRLWQRFSDRHDIRA